jgi:hypothetical protein
MKKLAVLLLTLLWLTVAPAQQEPTFDTSGVEEIRRYTVEVIVFRYVEDFGLGTEQFYPDPLPAETGEDMPAEDLGLIDEVSVEPTVRGMDLLTYAVNADALHFELLQEDDYTMTDVLDRFERLDAYETILHAGWTQPTLLPEHTRPVDLRVLGPVPEGLDGAFTLYLSRYLHLVVDLALTADVEAVEEAGIEQPVPSYGDPVTQFGDPFLAEDMPVYYRIQEDRIVKNGDLRYFDHPKFGIVAKVTRVEQEPEANGENDLLGSSRQ